MTADERRRLVLGHKRLSILIPTLTSRMAPLSKLLSVLAGQGAHRQDIEILAILDARTTWLGDKRNQLLDLAKGDYLTFLNDDDMVVPGWVDKVMAYLDEYNGADVLAFQAECFERENPYLSWGHHHYMATSLEFEGHHSVEYPNGSGGTEMIMFHPPAMWCVWKSSIAKQARFGSRTYGEDHDWMMAVRKIANTQALIREVMYLYYADDRTSEAGVFRNEYEGYLWAGTKTLDADPGIVNADCHGVHSEASA